MKKEAQKKEINKEVLEGVAMLPDYKIVRKIQDDGSVLYYHPIDLYDPEPVKGEDLYDVVMIPIRRFKALVELLDQDDWQRFGFLAEAIIEETERRYEEVFHFLKKAVGEIEIDIMGRRSVIYRTGRVLGARITKQEVSES